MKHLAFPSIEQFRNVVKVVNDRTYHNGFVIKPIITFHGHVKAHGTNAAIVFDTQENVFYAQSRSNVLHLTYDNAGFCQYFETHRNFFENWLRELHEDSKVFRPHRYISIYGEWAGGTIQKNVAISGLPKMFLVFAIRLSNLDDEGNPKSEWYFDNIEVPKNDTACWSIETFGKYIIQIDFNNPELAQNLLVERTEAVEAQCPIGKYFGNEGMGEGVCWHGVTSNYPFYVSDLLFKVKGEKHSASKVKTLAAVDVEMIDNINELVNSLATLNRFTQAKQVLTEQGLDMDDFKNTREFITWVKNDIIKEDTDTILASNLDFENVIRAISNLSGKWFTGKI